MEIDHTHYQSYFGLSPQIQSNLWQIEPDHQTAHTPTSRPVKDDEFRLLLEVLGPFRAGPLDSQGKDVTQVVESIHANTTSRYQTGRNQGPWDEATVLHVLREGQNKGILCRFEVVRDGVSTTVYTANPQMKTINPMNARFWDIMEGRLSNLWDEPLTQSKRPKELPPSPLPAMIEKHPASSSQSPLQMECCVCLDGKRDVVFIPCGHLVACSACGFKLLQGRCPICRDPVNQVQRVYIP